MREEGGTEQENKSMTSRRSCNDQQQIDRPKEKRTQPDTGNWKKERKHRL